MSPQSQSEFTAPTFIVVRDNLQQQAENAAITADPEGGAGTFIPGTPLRQVGDPTNTIVAYWTRWQMKPTQRAAFAQSISGPINVLSINQQPNLLHEKWLFDNSPSQWTSGAVLNALGFAILLDEE